MSVMRAIPAIGSSGDRYVRNLGAVCATHNLSWGTPADLAPFLRALQVDKHLAMEFWSVVARFSDENAGLTLAAANGAVLEMVVQAVTGRSVAEMIAAGSESRRLVGQLGGLLAGEEDAPEEPAPAKIATMQDAATAPRAEDASVEEMRADLERLKAAFDARFGSQTVAESPAVPRPAALPPRTVPAGAEMSLSDYKMGLPDYRMALPALEMGLPDLERTLAEGAGSPVEAQRKVHGSGGRAVYAEAQERARREQAAAGEPVDNATAPAGTSETVTALTSMPGLLPAAPPQMEGEQLDASPGQTALVRKGAKPAPGAAFRWVLCAGLLMVVLGLAFSAWWWMRPAPGAAASGVPARETAAAAPRAAVPQVGASRATTADVRAAHAAGMQRIMPPAEAVGSAGRAGAHRLQAPKQLEIPAQTSAPVIRKQADAVAVVAGAGSAPLAPAPPPLTRSLDTSGTSSPTLPAAQPNVAAVAVPATGSVPREGSAPAPVVRTAPASIEPVRLSSGVQHGEKIFGEEPVYPLIAKQEHVSGVVVLEATISKAGTVEGVRVVSGPGPLRGSAIDAVKTWRYKPSLLNGQPVEVQTTVAVKFQY